MIRLIDGGLSWCEAGSDPTPLQSQEQIEALQAGLAGRRVQLSFCVPGEALRLQTLTVQPEEVKHLAKSLPFMLEEQVADDIEDIHVSWMVLDKDDIGVALCRRQYGCLG